MYNANQVEEKSCGWDMESKKDAVLFFVFFFIKPVLEFGMLQIAMASTTFGRARDRMQLSTTICDRALKLVHKKMTQTQVYKQFAPFQKGVFFWGQQDLGGVTSGHCPSL